MSRVSEAFARAAAERRAALIPYITAGDGGRDRTLAVMQALADSGADLIELGVPFSDPMADGPVIQAACQRALVAGTTLEDVFGVVADFRRDNAHTPVVLMGYMNPLECYGLDRAAQRAAAVGVDAFLVVDCPPEEAQDLDHALRAHDLDHICLVAPTSTEKRLHMIAERARGFVYLVGLKGVTGAEHLDHRTLAEPIGRMRRHTDLPIAVGFGIRDPEGAGRVGALADGVVIGSALIKALADSQDHAAAANRASEFMRPIVAALAKA